MQPSFVEVDFTVPGRGRSVYPPRPRPITTAEKIWAVVWVFVFALAQFLCRIVERFRWQIGLGTLWVGLLGTWWLELWGPDSPAFGWLLTFWFPSGLLAWRFRRQLGLVFLWSFGIVRRATPRTGGPEALRWWRWKPTIPLWIISGAASITLYHLWGLKGAVVALLWAFLLMMYIQSVRSGPYGGLNLRPDEVVHAEYPVTLSKLRKAFALLPTLIPFPPHPELSKQNWPGALVLIAIELLCWLFIQIGWLLCIKLNPLFWMFFLPAVWPRWTFVITRSEVLVGSPQLGIPIRTGAVVIAIRNIAKWSIRQSASILGVNLGGVLDPGFQFGGEPVILDGIANPAAFKRLIEQQRPTR